MGEMGIEAKRCRPGNVALRLGISLLLVYTPAALWAQSVAEEIVVAEPTAEVVPTTVPDIAHLATQLKLGMTYQDIVKLLGAPGERREMEAKRSAVWEYGSHKILFREGRVVAWTSFDATGSDNEAPPHMVGAPSEIVKAPAAKREPPDEDTIRSLLGEILESSQGGTRPSTPNPAEGTFPDAEQRQDGGVQDEDRASLPPLVQQLSPY